MSKDDFVDYYRLLDVGFNATEDAIDRAYRSKIKEHHPDRHGGSSEAAEQTKRLIEARGVLKDPAKRKAYNERWLARAAIRLQQAWKKAASRPTAPEPQPRPSPPPTVTWTPPPSPPPVPNVVPGGGGGWGMAAGLFATLVSVYVLSKTNGYDRRTGRYRGPDGTFRSGPFS